MATSDFSLQFQGKVHNTCDTKWPLFLATIRVTSNISITRNTKKWPLGQKMATKWPLGIPSHVF